MVCVNCGKKLPAVCTDNDEKYDVTIAVEDHVCEYRDFVTCKVIEHVFVDGVCAQCGKIALVVSDGGEMSRHKEA